MATKKAEPAAEPAKKETKKKTQTVQYTTQSGKKVEHTITHVEAQSSSPSELQHITKGNATPFRILAIVLWILALGFEVVAILLFMKKISIINALPNVWQAVIALGLDLICLIVGSQMWKKANHMEPASEKNKLKFWLQNNLGVIVAAVAFIPFIIIALTDKNASKQDKTIATIAAAIALAVGVLTGIDYNPVSQEQLQEAADTIKEDVFWTAGGTVYHTHDDCGHLANSGNLFTGSVTAAVEAGKVRLCKSCAHRDGIENVVTDNAADVENLERVDEQPNAAD